MANFLPRPIDRNCQGLDAELIERWNSQIQILMTTYRLSSKLHVLQPSQGAIELLDSHYDSILQRRGSDLSRWNSYAARWNEQAWRLCVVLQAGEYGATAHEHEVSAQTAQNAIMIANWFAEDQLRVLGWSRAAAEKDLQRLVVALAAEHPEGLVAADVYHKRLKPNAEEARQLLSQMEKNGLLECHKIPRPGGGWLSEKYCLRGHA